MLTTQRPFRRSLIRAAVLLLAAALSPGPAAAEEKTGEQLYRQQCARCHGPQGEGTKKYDRTLAGDKSVAQLAQVVRETMPEDKPGTLSPADAQMIAAYMHAAFYSPTAQA